jgi:crotonobetainyl-CoA:carnitine CoA-transferase CaiB-like acyl-CoA transferase
MPDLGTDGSPATALGHLRICDFSGQLAGAGATKILAAFGAEVIRVEDPITEGRWDMLRGIGPFVDERRGTNLGGGFNNHNVGKLGVTLNLRTEEGRELARELIATCDAVTENFAPGVLERRGFGYEQLREIRPDIVYVSNSGFGHTGPYREFKTWGPIVQAMSGLTFTSGLPDEEPAGWGFSYMDHGAAFFMVVGLLAALHRRAVTGEGEWVDLSSVIAGITMLPTEVLDWSVNGRSARRAGEPHGNRSDFAEMAPHGIYPAQGDDRWVAIACRDDGDWASLAEVIGADWSADPVLGGLAGRLADQDRLDRLLGEWTSGADAVVVAEKLLDAGVPATVVRSPEERIDHDPDVERWGLFPQVTHPEMGVVRVEGLPLRFSDTPWSIEHAAPTLGQHNRDVFGAMLGHSDEELDALGERGVL